jgi:hypothetical protein
MAKNVTNFYIIKRMLLVVLQAAHEQTFGVLEIDIQKRVKQQ